MTWPENSNRCGFLRRTSLDADDTISSAELNRLFGAGAEFSSLSMKIMTLLAVAFGSMQAAFGGELIIKSPDHAQTFAYGEMVRHQLYVDPATHVFTARVTLSNSPYVGDGEPRVDEPFDFRFPGVQVNPANRTLFARARRGDPITVAVFHGEPECGWIDLAPGAKIYLLKKSGRVSAVLTATDQPRVGMRWIEMDNNWSLQNLLAELFGRFREPRG
jgi:hypothetical protein